MAIVKKLADNDFIRIGNYNMGTDVLGPGIRFVLWVQGCMAGCKGCIAPEMQAMDKGKVISVDLMTELILSAKNIEGITISGGEPFFQADKLCQIIENIRKIHPDFSVIIYTGYAFEQLEQSEEYAVQKLINEYADVIIDGRYVEELNDNVGLRGSSNQRVIYITERYKGHTLYENPRERKNRFVTDGGRMYMVGVPTRTTEKLLQKLKNQSF